MPNDSRFWTGTGAEIPPDEIQRIEALRRYEILDTPPEENFERLTRLAARLFDAPIALVSLVDEARQWSKSARGLAAKETPRGQSFCAHAILESGPMVVTDPAADPRFRENPLVTGSPHIRFYAGVPLTTAEGYRLGTICAIDSKHREAPDPERLGLLEDLAALVVSEMERRRVNKALLLASQQLGIQAKAKNDFLAAMSHEIRTPLNLIMGMNTLLLDSPLNQQQRKHIDIAHRNMRRLLRLVNGILDLSRVEAGELLLEKIEFRIPDLVEECVETVAAAVAAKGLRLKVEIGSDLKGERMGDPARLQQILLNLLGNAVKFTESGEIGVVAEMLSEGVVQFTVTDTGCGIEADQMENIFGPFQQADISITRRYEGTGLGLSIAKKLVGMMDGQIKVESQPGRGSQFSFTVGLPKALPATPGPASVCREPAAVTRSSDVPARILVVEDNEDNLFLLECYLDGQPYQVHPANNGQEAIEMVQLSRFDLILMDIQMPIMDGLTATRKIRLWERDQGRREVPIVALTANAMAGAAEECLEAGCTSYLSKPVEREDLLRAIQMHRLCEM